MTTNTVEAIEAGRARLRLPTPSAATAGRLTPAVLAVAGLAAVGQTVALPLVEGAAGVDPWLIAAIFGGAAALASFAVGKLVSRPASAGTSPAGAADDLALHDALSLAVLLAAAPIIGIVGMILLIPGTVILSRVLVHVARTRRVSGEDTLYLAIPLITAASMSEIAGWHGFVASLAVLAVAAAVRAWQRGLSDERRDAPWLKWAVTGFLCAAGAAIGFDEGIALPGDAALLMALVAGVCCGAAAQLGTARLPRETARIASASAPFLALGITLALGSDLGAPQIAAAILLALAITGSAPLARRAIRSVSDRGEALERPLNALWSNGG